MFKQIISMLPLSRRSIISQKTHFRRVNGGGALPTNLPRQTATGLPNLHSPDWAHETTEGALNQLTWDTTTIHVHMRPMARGAATMGLEQLFLTNSMATKYHLNLVHRILQLSSDLTSFCLTGTGHIGHGARLAKTPWTSVDIAC